MRNLVFAIVFALSASVVQAQTYPYPTVPTRAQTVDMSGPRVGATWLSPATRDIADQLNKDIGPVVSQFGWQWERRFLTTPGGGTAVTEWVALIGGADQGVFLPSVSWLVGYRADNGVEFAAGPNLGINGAAIAFAGGMTFRAGALNVPVNLALVPSRSGARVSVLVGFNTRR